MKNITHKNDTYSLPMQLVCTVSGLKKTYTSQDYVNGKLDRFGGLANLIAKYICREALKLRKAGKNDDEIKAHFADRVAKQDAPKVTTPTAEVKPELPSEPAGAPPAVNEPHVEVQAETAPVVEVVATEEDTRPIAKKDSKGKWRNAKGHLISEFNLKNFRCLEPVAA